MSLDTAVALVAVADARTVLKIAGSSEDTVLADLINRASALASKYAGRQLVSTQRTEYYDGDGDRQLILNHRPVTAVASVYIDGLRTFGADTLVDSAADLITDGAAGILELWNNGGSFTKGRANVKVTYTAGYVAGSTVPHDLEEAVLLIVQHHYKRIYQDGRIGLQSETLDDRTLTYSQDAIPPKAKMILERYRDVLSPGGGHA
jgi:uncharacterized phiE125 gp8 family phage protein